MASFQDRFDIFIMNKSLSRVHFDPVIGVNKHIISACTKGLLFVVAVFFSEDLNTNKALYGIWNFYIPKKTLWIEFCLF